MSDIEFEILRSEAALAALRSQQAADGRESLKQQLRDTRQKLRSVRAEYNGLAAQILRIQDERIVAQKRTLAIIQEVSDHAAKRPEVADFLPDDIEVVRWQQHHDNLIAARERATAEIPPEPSRTRAILLLNDISTLEHSERSLIERLRGSLGKFSDGGIYAVSGN